MSRLVATTLLLILSNSVASASELWLRVGEARFIKAPPESVVRVGKRGIAKVIDEPDGIRIIGLSPGATTLIIDRATYNLRVSESAQKDFAVALKKRMGEMMGIKLSEDTQSLEVHGQLLRFSDWLAIAELARRHQGKFVFRAQTLSDVAEQAMSHFRLLLNREGLPVLRFSAQPQFTAYVPPRNPALKKSIEALLAPYGIAVSAASEDIQVQPLVRTRVILAEVSKSFAQSFGVYWPSELKAQLLPKAQTSEQLLISLKAMEAHGQAQILASPNLLCRSGGEARFHAGGEFPIRLIGRGSKEVVWKPHGVLLNVKPMADFRGAISLEIETEVSLLDLANSVDGLPAIKKSTVRTQFDVPARKTVAISGLLRQELGQSREGWPWLTELPILGPLFSSRHFRNQKSELVVFVTPEIQNAGVDESVHLPEGWVTDVD